MILLVLACLPILATVLLAWLAARSWRAFAWCTLLPALAMLLVLAVRLLLAEPAAPDGFMPHLEAVLLAVAAIVLPWWQRSQPC